MSKKETINGYYYYHNWVASKENQIHIGSCGYCNYGNGRDTKSKRGERGVWVGPFDSKELAQMWAAKYSGKNLPIGLHSCTKIL